MRLQLISAMILLIGLISAIAIYSTAENSSDNLMDFAADSKMYRHNLELYGGKMNVLANELIQGFVGLWRGETLAFTVAFLAAIVSFGLFLYAGSVPRGTQSGSGSREKRRESD